MAYEALKLKAEGGSDDLWAELGNGKRAVSFKLTAPCAPMC